MSVPHHCATGAAGSCQTCIGSPGEHQVTAVFVHLSFPSLQYTAYVPLPDQRAIELRVLEKKKADLMSKYTSESLLQEQSDAKSLLNKK